MISQSQLLLYAKQILNDYDKKEPSILFKNDIKITVAEAYKVQSLVTALRIKRGEKVIGYKIGSVQKKTQKKYGFSHPAWGRLSTHTLMSHAWEVKILIVLHINVLKGVLLAPRRYHFTYTSND